MIRCVLSHCLDAFFDTFSRSIHSGLTVGPVKMDFGRAQKSAYKNHIAPAFGTFLKKCYSKLSIFYIYSHY